MPEGIVPLRPSERSFVGLRCPSGLLPRKVSASAIAGVTLIPMIAQTANMTRPVPDKVADDMRACGAAIIHVDADRELMTREGGREVVLNGNVLIEIGAAMALLGRRDGDTAQRLCYLRSAAAGRRSVPVPIADPSPAQSPGAPGSRCARAARRPRSSPPPAPG
jgi:hypothetical protein